jgi:hypothetical protein
VTPRRFPPPWSIKEADSNSQVLAVFLARARSTLRNGMKTRRPNSNLR